MKIFVASHNQAMALAAKAIAKSNGHHVVSTWHDGRFRKLEEIPEDERVRVADRNIDEVIEADVVLLCGSREGERVAGAKFVEAGVAIALGKGVLVWGRRENMNLWSHRVDSCESIQDIPTLLKSYEADHVPGNA